jgi:hypothetical protein
MIVVPKSLVLTILAVEVGVLLALFIAIMLHTFRLVWRRRHDPVRLHRAAVALAVALDTDRAEAGPDLEHLSTRLREKLLSHIAANIRGEQRQRLAVLATRLGMLNSARRWARSWWWWRRLRGAHLLATVFSVDPHLPDLMEDRHPVVRSEAINWAGDHVSDSQSSTDELSEALVRHLVDRSLLCRAAAADALTRAGVAAAPVIEGHLRDLSNPSRISLLRIAAARPSPRYLATALTLCKDPQPPIRAAVAGLLGSLGGDPAAEALEALLRDESFSVRAAAAAGLGRLNHWPAAPLIAPMLRDRSWDVRRAAGEALAGLGAPGTLLLRRFANDADPYAADMAQRVSRTAALRALLPEGASG